jgi:hypothetical protein
MENFATNIAYASVGLSELIKGIKSLPGFKFIKDLIVKTSALKPNGWGALVVLGKKKAQVEASQENNKQGLAHLSELESTYTKDTLGYSKKLTSEETKQLNAKKLQLAIDKANLALGKGSNLFDIEKIQLAAAEKNQAEQLGKITNQAQLLQITNDLARLRVKQDIIALEDAIASKDVAAITAATNKLNADLQIVGALNGQKVKLTEIDDILKSIVPKDLINLKNLDEAIAKLKVVGSTTASAASTSASTSAAPSAKSINEMLAAGSFVPIVAGTNGVMGGSSNAGNYASYGFPGSDRGYSTNSTPVSVTNYFGVVGDPNAAAELMQQTLQDAIDRGTLRVTV